MPVIITQTCRHCGRNLKDLAILKSSFCPHCNKAFPKEDIFEPFTNALKKGISNEMSVPFEKTKAVIGLFTLGTTFPLSLWFFSDRSNMMTASMIAISFTILFITVLISKKRSPLLSIDSTGISFYSFNNRLHILWSSVIGAELIVITKIGKGYDLHQVRIYFQHNNEKNVKIIQFNENKNPTPIVQLINKYKSFSDA